MPSARRLPQGANNAPVLNAMRSPVLAAEVEDAGVPSGAVGTLASALVDFAIPAGGLDNVTDSDIGALLGIAVIGANAAVGTWYYSTNGGNVWNTLGAVSDSSARLLAADSNTRLYLDPAANFNGSVANAITLRAWDRTSGTSGMTSPAAPGGGSTAFSAQSDTASLSVLAVNDAPVITSIPPSPAVADVAYIYNATKTDVDGPGTTWSLLEASHTCGGTIVAASGVFTFTPAGPTPPPDCVVSITICDGAPVPNELCGFQTATIRITASNLAPVFTSPPNFSVPENQTAVATVTSNDPDGGPPAYTLIGGADVAGFAIQAASGVLTFVSAPNFEAPTDANANNVYEVTVEVSDGSGGTAIQAIGVTVTNANDAPVINSSAPASATEDTLYTYNATRTDPDGPGQNWSLVAGTHTCGGTIVAASGVFTFTPLGPVPPASCVVAVQVCDGGAPDLCASQSRTVTVAAVNDAPVISSTAPTAATSSTAYTYNATRTDPDGPGQAWSLVAGTHTCGGTIGATSGSFTFTPAASPPPNCVVSIQICDGGSPNLCATQSSTVTISATNSAPTSSAPATASTGEDTNLNFTGGNLLGVADADGSSLTVTLSVANGTLTLGTLTGLAFTAGDGTADTTMTFSATQASLNTALGSLRYAPTADYNGNAALTFTTSDGIAAPLVKTVVLTITAVVDIVNDTVSTNEDSAISFNAITGTNGASADNFEGNPSVASVTQGSSGGVSSMGNGTLMYSPSPNFNGSDGFTYTVTSGGVAETGSVTVNVTPVNDAPTLNPIADPAPILVSAGLQTIGLTGIGRGAGDPAQTLAVTAVSNNVALIPNPAITYASPNATGSLTYTPAAGQQGSALITVTVTDNGGIANGGVNTISRSFTQVVSNGSLFANGFE